MAVYLTYSPKREKLLECIVEIGTQNTVVVSKKQYLVSTRLIGLSMTLGICLQGKTLDLIKALCEIDRIQGALSKSK